MTTVGTGDNATRQKKSSARLVAARREDRERAADETEHEHVVNLHRGAICGEIVRVSIDDEHQDREDEVEHDRLSAIEQKDAQKCEQCAGAGVDIDEFAEDVV